MCQNDVEEMVEHLFFQCSTAVSRWFALGITCNEHSNIHQKNYIARENLRQPSFMEIFLISALCLWNERNDYIFKNKPPSIATWRSCVKNTIASHLAIIKPCTFSP
jgi:hypothetical protein